MKLSKLKKVILPTLAIGVFSTMTVFAATGSYTIQAPVITKEYTEDSYINTTIDVTMNANPADCLALSVTPYYSSRGSSTLFPDTAKWISSGSEKVTQLKGSVDFSVHMSSHKVYMEYLQEGYVTDSDEYTLVAKLRTTK